MIKIFHDTTTNMSQLLGNMKAFRITKYNRNLMKTDQVNKLPIPVFKVTLFRQVIS